MQVNIRGLMSKQDSLKYLLNEFHTLPDIVLLCETWLKRDTENNIHMPGYKCYHKHRSDRLGGGVSILVRQQLRSRERSDLIIPTFHFEYNVVELKTNSSNVLLISGYRPPNTNPRQFMKEYRDVLTKLKEVKGHELIIGMDHNFDLLKSANNKTTSKFLDLNIERDLTPCITKPTRVTNRTATLIDNILVSNRLQYNYTPYVVVDDLSDHYPALVVLNNIEQCKKDKVKIAKRKIDSKSLGLIRDDLDNIDWNCLDIMNVNEAFDCFHSTLTSIIDKHCPKREFSISYGKITRDPWITKGLSNSIRRQKKLYQLQLHTSDPDDISRYISYRNTLKKLLRRSKLSYFNKKCIEYKQNSRKLWQLINQVINKIPKKSQVIESLRIGNLVKYSPQEITKGFCDHFAQIGRSYASRISTSRVLVETYSSKIKMCASSLFLLPTDKTEIRSLIMNLPAKNSSGHDEISNNLLKNLCPSLLNPLDQIFNKSLSNGVFPELMKKADVSPLFKSKLENDANNYRPISLLITISKVLEKIVYQRTYTFLERTGQIYNSQYGFRSQHSCESAVSELISEIIKGFQNGMYTAALFLDLSKAFDTLEHKVLLDKMYRYGIRGSSLDWFRSYLENRKIRVKCRVASSGRIEHSEYQTVNYGTPQGSCLGPLIFLIFTNDLNQHLHHCSSILFADDTTLYKTHRNLNYLEWCLQDDMQTLTDWFKANKLTLNLDKTVCILFQQKGSDKAFKIQIDTVKIRTSNEIKFLGMWLDSHLNWSVHIQRLVTRLKRNATLLRVGNKLLTKDCKRLVYFAHIQSHLQYGILLWGNHLTLQQLNKLIKIQESCLKYIGPHSGFKENKVLKADSLIELENSKFGYKLTHGLLPKQIEIACMFDQNKSNLQKTHNYHTRHKKVPNIPIKMNKQYRASFLNKGSQSLLTIKTEIKEKPNIKSFTRALKNHLLSQY